MRGTLEGELCTPSARCSTMSAFTAVFASIFLLLLPLVLVSSVLGLLLGGTGLKRIHLAGAALLSAGTLWMLAATRYVVGRDDGTGVGKYLSPLLSWVYSLCGVTASSMPQVEYYILVGPFVFLAALGCYALATVGFNLYRFNDCEEASAELTRVRLFSRQGQRVCVLDNSHAAASLTRPLYTPHSPSLSRTLTQ